MKCVKEFVETLYLYLNKINSDILTLLIVLRLNVSLPPFLLQTVSFVWILFHGHGKLILKQKKVRKFGKINFQA